MIYDDDYDDLEFESIPTQEELDDAMIEDTVHCGRCNVACSITDTYQFDDRSVCVECLQEEIDEVLKALDDSVKLQSHYARLLNIYDDGRRLTFKDAAEWLERLRYCREINGESQPGDTLPGPPT